MPAKRSALGLLDRRLLFVTGKGGVGKTSVASALGHLAASHGKRGWEALTDGLIAAAAAHAAPKVFMLWGAHAQSKLGLIAASGRSHLVLQCNHPSPLSATRGPVPFVGCGHFSQAAAFVAAQGGTVAWSL